MAAIRSNEVRVEQYDVRWPACFAAEADALRALLGRRALRVEHIGSTSIADLPAKPIIDIAVEVDAFDPWPPIRVALEGAGYTAKGEFGLPGRQFFTREEPQTFHVHVVESGSAHLAAWRTFRDKLRASRSLCEAYASLKQDLARRFPDDRPSYTAAKSEFVRSVLDGSRTS